MPHLDASRSAAIRLSMIVGVILLPLIFITFLMVSGLRRDTAIVEYELSGARMISNILPVLHAVTLNQPVSANLLDTLITSAASDAEALDLSQELSSVATALRSRGIESGVLREKLNDLLHDVTVRSGLKLDSQSEALELAMLSGIAIPDVFNDFLETHEAFGNNGKEADSRTAKSTAIDVLLGIGRWQESIWRAGQGVDAAMSANKEDPAYGDLKAQLALVSNHAENIAALFDDIQLDSEISLSTISGAFLAERDAYVTDVMRAWNSTNNRLVAILASRVDQLEQRTILMVALATFASLLGVGTAASWFHSTLKKLDLIEEARKEAERARKESELSATDIRRVNDDVVLLNSKLFENVLKLKEAQNEIVRKGRLSQLGQLTATVAHELRNPLGAVRTSAFLLERKLKGKDLGIEQQIERINTGILRCDVIITQLLDFARQRALSTQHVQMDTWLAAVVREEVSKLPADQKVEIELGLGNLEVEFDAASLSRVIINLLSNASEALAGMQAPRQGVLPDTSFKPTITISSCKTARGAEICIADNGPGMIPEILDKMRQPLFTTKSFGTGLGIPAVEKVLEQHHGGLDISSRPGQGTEAIAWLPLSQPASAPAMHEVA